jgi:predicted ATPase/class 3 adenylate cyclase
MAGEARALPTGTVTFLFTDVERSTQTVADVGDERYAEMQEHHRKLLREAFVAHNGVEVGREGDALFIAFATATDAVSAAIDGQRALSEHSDLRVRMGLHTGEALVRDGDYVGHEVHRAKRISDAGHGGQILLSQTTTDLIGSRTRTKELGAFRLKDLGEPQRISQIVVDGLPTEFPRLRTLDTFRTNLPEQRTSFIGREVETAVIQDYVGANRLVTLTGVGGAGKTRLATHVAAEMIDAFPAGVFFVDLARVTDGDALGGAIASALGIVAQTLGANTIDALDEIIRTLSGEPALVVLDNCEHLIEDVADMADRLLSSCPRLRVIATSREALEIEGEQTYTVPSLAVRQEGDDLASPAVALFCDRAIAVRPGFALTAENKDAVAEICARLDGVPLAIELAAAQIGHLSAVEVAERLNDRFKLLTGGRRRIQRQQTLGATLDWSHDLLSDPERVLLRRLAVFPGSFSLDAAESVGRDDIGAPVIAALRTLVRKSLVVADDDGDQTRYRMLETVRLYAEDKLLAAGESALARGRHADHFWAVSQFDDFHEVYGLERSRWCVREGHNVRAALAWSLETDDAERLAHFAIASMPLWAASFDEGARWARLAMERSEGLDLETRGALIMLSAWICGHRGRWLRSFRFAQDAIDLAGPDPEPSSWLATAYTFQLGIAAYLTAMGDPGYEAIVRERLSQAESMIPSLVPEIGAYALTMIGSAKMSLGDHEGAAEAYAHAIATYPSDRDPNLAGTLAYHARALMLLGRYEEAAPSAERAASMNSTWREFSGSTEYAWDLQTGVAQILSLAWQGRFSEAKEYTIDLVTGAENTSMATLVSNLLVTLAEVAILRGDHARATRLLGKADTLGLRETPSAPHARAMDEVNSALTDHEVAALLAEGAAMSQPEAIAYGIEGIDP